MPHEAVELLSRYLQIDTTNPPGNEKKGVEFFAAVFEKENVGYRIYEAAPGRQSIRAMIPGTGERPALVLLNHIDVVAADAGEWREDPFGGKIKDGYIHGRGALDMKGQGILELLAFLEVKRRGWVPCRDLIFLAVADEEAGGKNGAAWLLEQHPQDFQAGLVLNEGGFGLHDTLPDRPLFLIAAAEKGVCRVRLTRTGPPGHGSTPHGDNALEKLVQALNRLLEKDNPFTVTPLVADYFRQLGTVWDFLKPYLADGQPETLIRVLSESGMAAIPQLAAMLQNTVSLNRLHAGHKINVIPAEATAELDVRLLPGTDPDAFVAEIKTRLADDKIQVEVMAKHAATQSPVGTEDFSILTEAHLKHFPEALVVASLLYGASDSRFFRDRGMACYGVCPMLISTRDLGRVHGVDERISTENMIRGTRVYIDIVRMLCRV